MIENAFSEDATFNPALKTGSPLLTGATFTKNGVVSIDDAFFTKVDYRDAIQFLIRLKSDTTKFNANIFQ